MSSKSSTKNTAGQTILAGGFAGGLESLLTFPTEYIKTQQQLVRAHRGQNISPLTLLVETVRHKGVKQLYRGASAFCAANASKSAVRFFTFDFVSQKLRKSSYTNNATTINLAAGFAAGVTEGLLVVTPGETLKTKLIDDRNRLGGPKFNGTFSVIRHVLATEGILGFYRGALPVTIKQSSNAVVRFTSYSFLVQHLRNLTTEKYRSFTSVLAGGGAGIVTVYCTMPMDNIKTRLQAIGGSERYSGTWNCLRSMIASEGVASLWRGTTPRLMRLTVSAKRFSFGDNY